MFHRLSLTPVPEFAKRVSAKHRSDARCSLPMNRTHKLLEMNECSKTGSWAQGAIKVRGDLSLSARVRVRRKRSPEYAKLGILQGFLGKGSLIFVALLSVLILPARLLAQKEVEITHTGEAKRIPISLEGYSGEALSVLRFDLEIQGYEITTPDKAQYLLS